MTEPTPPRSNLSQEYSASSTDDGTRGSHSSQSAVRLVKRSLESDMIAESSGEKEVVGVNIIVEATEPLVQSPVTMSPRSPTPSQLQRIRRDATSPPSRTTTPVPSTSRVHWNQLRNAIIPGVPINSSNRSLPSDAPQSGSTTAPPRPQTPKPSRLARLGFRQVVEHTREVFDDEVGKFEAEVYQACAFGRFGDVRQKVERDASQATYLPFVSTTSLPLSTVTVTSQTNKSNQPSESVGRTPSLKLLHQTLVHYASISPQLGIMLRLPYESDILSVLLIPFTMEAGLETEERWLAVETLEILAKTWRGSSQQVMNRI